MNLLCWPSVGRPSVGRPSVGRPSVGRPPWGALHQAIGTRDNTPANRNKAKQAFLTGQGGTLAQETNHDPGTKIQTGFNNNIEICE